MNVKSYLSKQTQTNWLVDLFLFSSAIIAVVSGIYFLYFPVGGYQGGRNLWYGITILFERHTWEDLHTWGGVAMIIVAAVHLAIHWSWVTSMVRRVYKELTGQCVCMNARGRFNLLINILIGLSFLITAISGIYLLFVPGGRTAVDPVILFSRTTWDLIHTWAGVLMIIAASLHFAIHWMWVTKVSKKIMLMVGQMLVLRQVPRKSETALNTVSE